MNGPQALQVNPGCFKCISDINLSPANKTLLTILFIYTFNEVAFNGIAFNGTAFNGIAFKTKYHPILLLYLMVF